MADLVLVAGDELMVESAVLEEKARALGDLDPAWALTELSPGAAFADGLAATAMLGLGVERRVVLVRRAGALDAAAWDSLLGYLGSVPDHVSLIVEGSGWSSPARSRQVSEKVKAGGGRVRREDLPSPAKRADFVRQQAERKGLRLDARAARHLAQFLGDEIGNLPGHLDQLIAIHGPGARLGEDEVAALFQGARHGFQWDITDALDRGDAAVALEYVHGALDAMHPLALHAALVNHFRRLVLVAGRDLTPAQVATHLGLKEYPARKVAEQAARLGRERAKRAYELLAEADVALRGGGVALDERGVLDVLVVQLCELVRP